MSPTARFVLDESAAWSPEIEADVAAAGLPHVRDVLAIAHREGQQVLRHSAIFTALVGPDMALWKLLYDPEASPCKDRDARVQLQVSIDRCPIWDGSHDTSEIEALIDGSLQLAPSVVLAYETRTLGFGMACIPLVDARRRGTKTVSVGDAEGLVTWVASELDMRMFYREVIEIENLNEDVYVEWCALAFPRLNLAAGLSSQFRRFSLPYHEIRPSVTEHLAALNDYAASAFAGFPEPSVIAARMKSMSGVEMSPESPSTRGNPAAVDERRVGFLGREYVCEWHTKISPTVDRIHFHPNPGGPRPGPLIGIFVDHLLT